ncbi:MAG: hypothetical protein IT184_13805 [Acidobacteria bacterium]|nr:hypothetical protein [Acidobacteriota bacterium]
MRLIRMLVMAIMAAGLALGPTTLAAQAGSVQVTSADTKVYLSAAADSAVVMTVPVGAVLDVVASSGNWYQVRLPKDNSGFDRLGFIEKSRVKEMARAAAPSAAPAADTAAARGSRPTAAVLDFEFGAIEHWWSGTWNIGKGVSDMLVDELLQTGEVRLLERKRIESVLSEQNLANSTRADASAREVAQLGKVLGAKVLITGSITKFGSEERNVGGAAGSVAGRFLGGAGAKNTTATVALTVRAIDSSTSEILASAKAEAKSSRKGILLGGAFKGNFGAIDMNSRDFRETILGEATEKAVKEVATRLSVSLPNALR